MIGTRRHWLQTAAAAAFCRTLPAARKEFWESKEPAAWSDEEKQIVLGQSPWARAGLVRMELEPPRKGPGYASNGRPGVDMPDLRPGVPPGGVRSVPIGEAPPRAPKADQGRPIEFPSLARWETAKPVRLAGAPELPELAGTFYVIRLRGLPLLPPAKTKPGETPANSNEALLQAIQAGSYLERKGKPPIPCAHLFTGSGNSVNDVLLFFTRGADPIVPADKIVTLESRFTVFHLSIAFPLKEMAYRGELAL